MVRFGQIMRITQRDGRTKTQQLLDLVDASPGLSSRQLSLRLGETLSNASSQASRLTAMGRLKAVKQDGSFRYYPVSYMFSDDIEKQNKSTCDECGRTFKDARACRFHYLRAHTEEGKKWTGALRKNTPNKHKNLNLASKSPSVSADPLPYVAWLEKQLKEYIWDGVISKEAYTRPSSETIKEFYEFVKARNELSN